MKEKEKTKEERKGKKKRKKQRKEESKRIEERIKRKRKVIIKNILSFSPKNDQKRATKKPLGATKHRGAECNPQTNITTDQSRI